MDLRTINRELSTKNLYLRPQKLSDAEGLFAMLSDPESMKYWSHRPVNDVEDAVRVLREDMESDAGGNSVCWSIILNGEDRMIGKCILFQFNQANRRAEIGFILNRNYWRKGLMKQALEAVIDFAFMTLKLHRIEADVDEFNIGSLGILEKLGFQREGLFRDRWRVYGQWQQSIMLGLLKCDWLLKGDS